MFTEPRELALMTDHSRRRRGHATTGAPRSAAAAAAAAAAARDLPQINGLLDGGEQTCPSRRAFDAIEFEHETLRTARGQPPSAPARRDARAIALLTWSGALSMLRTTSSLKPGVNRTTMMFMLKFLLTRNGRRGCNAQRGAHGSPEAAAQQQHRLAPPSSVLCEAADSCAA